MNRDDTIKKYKKDRSLRDDYQLDEDENYLIDEIVNALKQGQALPIDSISKCDCGSEYYHTYECVNTNCENCIIHKD